MRYFNSESNQQQKPDIHDLLSLLQYTSPEAQQERQLQLQTLQAHLGTEQGTQAHEAAVTQQLQALTQHLPDEWKQQAAEMTARTSAANATATAENTRNLIEQGQLTAQPQTISDAHAKADADLAEIQARTGLLQRKEADPNKIMLQAGLVSQALTNPVLAATINQADPDGIGKVLNNISGNRQNALSNFTDLATRSGHGVVDPNQPIQVGSTTIPASMGAKPYGPYTVIPDENGLSKYFNTNTGQPTSPGPDELGWIKFLREAPTIPMGTNGNATDINDFLSGMKQRQAQSQTASANPPAGTVGSILNSIFGKY